MVYWHKASAILTCMLLLILLLQPTGLVFTPLTSWYLRSVYGTDWSCKAPIKLVEKAFAASMKHKGEEIVVLTKVLASDINLGYQDTGNIQVLEVNGTRVLNLAHMAHLINSCKDPFLKLQLEWNKVIITWRYCCLVV